MYSTTNILITGASRGIGKGLVAAYLNSPNTTVVAAVRQTASAGSLHSLATASGSRLVVVEIDVASVDSIKRGIASLKLVHGIDSLDVVLANAGVAAVSPSLSKIDVSVIQPFVDVNAYGQLELFMAVAPLLRKARIGAPGKFMYMSSLGGSLTTMNTAAPLSAYGASKALGNFLFKWLSLEQQDIIVWSQHPGIVATDMAQIAFESLKGVVEFDFEAQAVSVEQSCQDILRIVHNATLEETHGKFLGPDGGELPW
ncbi:hypothetical protein E8E12_002698 [Didymella heteroderae]|uniref:NAD(P)-binding protein n=1 Tax=Didymella heteroderae TaxID=1769908 RepID=A0A9P4WHG4_9PLEO|nr:hypothetical protein E8E12_002698 [Didymella heteroderae]